MLMAMIYWLVIFSFIAVLDHKKTLSTCNAERNMLPEVISNDLSNSFTEEEMKHISIIYRNRTRDLIGYLTTDSESPSHLNGDFRRPAGQIKPTQSTNEAGKTVTDSTLKTSSDSTYSEGGFSDTQGPEITNNDDYSSKVNATDNPNDMPENNDVTEPKTTTIGSTDWNESKAARPSEEDDKEFRYAIGDDDAYTLGKTDSGSTGDQFNDYPTPQYEITIMPGDETYNGESQQQSTDFPTEADMASDDTNNGDSQQQSTDAPTEVDINNGDSNQKPTDVPVASDSNSDQSNYGDSQQQFTDVSTTGDVNDDDTQQQFTDAPTEVDINNGDSQQQSTDVPTTSDESNYGDSQQQSTDAPTAGDVNDDDSQQQFTDAPTPGDINDGDSQHQSTNVPIADNYPDNAAQVHSPIIIQEGSEDTGYVPDLMQTPGSYDTGDHSPSAEKDSSSGCFVTDIICMSRHLLKVVTGGLIG